MGKRLRDEFSPPEPIIQHIQSFMGEKEAAQTTILSKEWYAAWRTRPNLYFDQRRFMRNSGDRGSEDLFWKFVNRTVQRYEKLNLKIESLSLWMYGTYYDGACSYSLANKLILKALRLGMVDLDFSIDYRDRLFELPNEVLESESLVRLSVNGCKIGVGANGKINCLKLESLCLDNVWLEGDIIWDLLSKCPIEKLSLCSCRFLFGTQNSNNVVLVTHFSMLELSPFIEFGKRNMGLGVDRPINPYEIHKLKCLSLYGVDVHTLFFDEISSKFPCLKDLGLHDCDNYKEIQISSPSLECINITHSKTLKVKLDVPNICKITFSSRHIPSLSLETGKSNWESYIFITCHSSSPSVSWFAKLNKLLTTLSLSRVSLSLKILHWNRSKCAGNIQGLLKPVMENLSVEASSSACLTLIDCLLRCCRPIFVTRLRSIGEERNKEFLEAIYERLIQQVSLNFLDNKSNNSLLCQDDLEEVSVEVFKEVVYGWRTLPWKSVLDSKKGERIRFRLRWGGEAATDVKKKDMSRKIGPFRPKKTGSPSP